MSVRIREVLRQNVIGLVALFVALGGTATALTGKNTVDSGDIKNNQVKSADVRDDTLSGGGLAAVDLAPNSVGSDELQDGVIIGSGAPDTAEVILGEDGIRVDQDGSQRASIDKFGQATFESNVTANGFQTSGAFSASETGPFGNPSQDQVLLYARDQGGLTQLIAQFADGDIDVLAQEAP
jgi:hypothetical protein